MKINWITKITIICGAALIFTLIWIILPGIWSDLESRYACRVDENLFSLGMESMNDTRKETFSLRQGDSIAVSAVFISGELDISIIDSSGNVIYEGNNPELGSFQVNIPKSDEYLISVTGRQAKGSISFQILRNEENEQWNLCKPFKRHFVSLRF